MIRSFDLNLTKIDLSELSEFRAAFYGYEVTAVDIAPSKTLNVFSTNRRDRSLTRSPLVVGSSNVKNCLFFGSYTGNGVSNMQPGSLLRTYDGGQFICSLDGFFAPDMLFAGNSIPNFVKPVGGGQKYRLAYSGDFDEIDDSYVYMGAYHAHFGHCLVESLTRLWYVLQLSEQEKAKTKFVFFQGWGSEGGPIAEILPWLGVPVQNIWVCKKNILFKNLVIPSFSWRPWNHWDIHLSKEFFAPLKLITQIATKLAGAPDVGSKIYLTRRGLDRSNSHYNRRELDPHKSDLIEADLLKRGFQIVAPETLGLAAQIALVGGASHIVGPGGSAHHLAAFAYSARAQIILTHEGFWMGGNDVVFAWDKPMDLAYVFGRQASDPSDPALTAPWDFELSDWEKAASNYAL